MEIDKTIRSTVGDIIAARAGTRPKDLKLERKTFEGAEAAQVALVTARYRDGRGRPNMRRMVVKHMEGRPAREAAVYRHLVAVHAAQMAPELLTVKHLGPEEALIFLEAVNKTNAWPWRDAEATGDVLARLGRFHTEVRAADVPLSDWDFEAEQASMAELTLSTLDQCRGDTELAPLARDLRALDRMVRALPELRRQLLAEQPFGCRPIHGDLHPGNAMMRRRNGGQQPILIDWGRARLGSPLEDVSSWLQSLRSWDWEAQRLHDTFFRQYLSAFGMPRRLTSEIRAAYWMAGASNALSGALLYHLAIAGDRAQRPASRATAYRLARDWLRVVRRAHAWTM